MCTLKGATGHLETVKDLCVDEDFHHLVLADSSGHIRMLDISELDLSTPIALARSFKQVYLALPATLAFDTGSHSMLAQLVLI